MGHSVVRAARQNEGDAARQRTRRNTRATFESTFDSTGCAVILHFSRYEPLSMVIREGDCTANPTSRPRPFSRLVVALGVCVFSAATPLPARATGLRQADCPSLEAWAARQTAGETISLAPKVEISSLLRDELVVPLVGKPVASWDAQDLSAVKRALNQCRKAANKRKDRGASDALYQAIRAIDGSRTPLAQMQRARIAAPRQVQWLIDYQPNPRLPGQLALAQDALQGRPVDPKQYGSRRRPDWLTTLQQASSYLPASEIEPLVARIAQRKIELEARAKAANSELTAARESLAKAPATAEGLAILEELAKLPALEDVPPKEADEFRRALQQKRWAIQRSLQQQQARRTAAEAAAPLDIDDRLAKILVGDEVDEVTLRGLRPGMPYGEAKRIVERDWGFGSGAGGDIMKEFAPTRRDMSRYTKSARRDGGRFEFQTMHGKVGQIKFSENYTGPLNIGSTYSRLEKRFGEPEKRQTDGAAVLARWRSGRSYLQAYVGNRVSGPRSTRTFRSSIVIQLWNRDYMDYLLEAQERCETLRHKPMGELSVADKQAMLTGCKSP
jgi:hypothetical protein